jgi:hypothetical protein
MQLVSLTLIFILHILQIVQSAIPTPNQRFRNNNTNISVPSKPTYNIGLIFPNVTVVKDTDPNLANMIVTSEVAIKLAAEAIAKSNILPGRVTDNLQKKQRLTFIDRRSTELYALLFRRSKSRKDIMGNSKYGRERSRVSALEYSIFGSVMTHNHLFFFFFFFFF